MCMNEWLPRAASSGQRGFTLLEMLVVLAMVVIVLAVVPPLISAGLPSAELKGAARKLAAGLRYTRSRAVSTQEEKALVVDLEERKFTVPDRPRAVSLPEDVEIDLLTTRSDLLGERTGRIRFFPDGSSTGGRITLEKGERKFVVDITWLTGRVVILE